MILKLLVIVGVLYLLFLASRILLLIFFVYRDEKRRRSLRQREDGTYVWAEWHGGQRTSERDPTAPGGQWYLESADDAGVDGGGDGGDGGGGD